MPHRRLAARLAVAAFLACALAPGAGAADLGRLTLADCLELAGKANNDLMAAQENIRKAEAVLTQAARRTGPSSSSTPPT